MSNVIAEVIDRHVEEAAILWCRRDCAAGEPHFTLGDLMHLDCQLEAQIDGMRVAEAESSDAAWTVCQQELRWNAPGEVFAAAVLAGESNRSRRIVEVTTVAHHCYDCSRALVAALGWLTTEHANHSIDRLLTTANPFERRVGIAACAVRGRHPGEALANAISSRDKLLKARALRAAGELARGDLLPAARKAMGQKDWHVRFSAAWAVARLSRDEPALRVLKQTVESQSPDQGRALQLVLRRMQPDEAAKWINDLATKLELLRQAVIATGVVGVPEAIPGVVQNMDSPPLARGGGEAFTMITGVDLAAQKMEGAWPAGFTAGPTEDPADNNVAMDEDENLLWPDATKLAAWWQKHSGELQPGTRYLCGQPMTEEWLEHVLRHGYQRQRAAAALELALLRPNEPLFNVRAPGQRQQELLGLR
jgi:uncharacterized protein (TIGR02270 family)